MRRTLSNQIKATKPDLAKLFSIFLVNINWVRYVFFFLRFQLSEFRGIPMTEQDTRNNGRSAALAMFMTVIVVGTALAVAFR